MTSRVTIEADKFLSNGEPTYAGRQFEGVSVEGQLFNTHIVQAIFDDTNPETATRWVYPDTGVWDPERNVREFIDALPLYRDHGITAVAVNLQGGMPVYRSGTDQPWENSAFAADGDLNPDYMDRLRRATPTDGDRNWLLPPTGTCGAVSSGSTSSATDRGAPGRRWCW